MNLKETHIRHLLYLLSLFFILTNSEAYAQQPITVPYYCGFENSTEISRWVLNYGPQGVGCGDKWVIGGGARSEGRSGLYISTDGATARYGWKYSNTVTAYRTFSVSQQLPYDISFDWMNNGVPGTSDLYVLLLMPADPLLESDSTSSYVLTGGASDIVSQRMVRPAFNNSAQWDNYSFQQTLRANVNYTLMFVWSNNNSDSTLSNPIGGCIDNIQIASTMCPKPTDFTVFPSCDTTVLSWNGFSTYYEAEYKLRGNYQWRKLGVQSAKYINILNLPEGMYDFRVRSVCPSDTSAYTTLSSVIIFCPANHCINFVELANISIVKASYGKYGNPCQAPGVIDFGSQNMASRHTVNWTQDEFDPRTEGRLRTIPPGSFASVRLGNWNNGAEGECLEYTLTVDSAASIILLKYAVLLEEPGHSEPPRFTLEILDEYGVLIDPTCGKANFEADGSLDWNVSVYKGSEVNWKDWTTVGFNLSSYVGQTLHIKLTTEDCNWKGHYGYAYFTLDCASATLTTNTCGDALDMSIAAPEGFTYKWTNPNYPDSVWHTREIRLSTLDSTTYYCEVCFIEEPSCCFTLSTMALPRFPVADFSYNLVTENCRNVLHFKNQSHVLTRYDGIEVHTSELCDMHFWDFGNGQSSPVFEPQLVCRNDGDTLDVTLTAYLGDCPRDTVIRIIVPPIGETLDLEYGEICQGDSYIFAGGRYYLMQGGTYYDTVPSVLTGCDSITKLELLVHPQYDLPVEMDTLCFGEVREFAGKEYKGTGIYEVWLKSRYGCDSVLTLNLYVRDEITFDLESTDVLSGPNSGEIAIKNASLSTYTYTVNGELNGSLSGLSGGIYTIVLYNEYGCASEPQEVIILQDCLEIEMGVAPFICGDDGSFEIVYTIGKGYPSTYDVRFSAAAVSAGFSELTSLRADGNPIEISLPSAVRPDDYEMNIVFEDLLCDSINNVVPFTVNYPSGVLKQKWNDVIAVYNSDNNGGYDFIQFQWYKNGELIEGESKSYIYIEDGFLDFTSEYCVLLTRKDDGKSIFSCPLEPSYSSNSEMSLYPLLLSRSEQVTLIVPDAAWVTVYDSMGRKRKSLYVPPVGSLRFSIADTEGYYIVLVQLDSGVQETFRITVR